MQLVPQYLDHPFIELDGDPATIAEPTIRQRRRLASLVASMTGDELQTPSRCSEWSVLDVLSHLDGTNRFWSLSIAASLAGDPSRVLDGFDPVATPAAMVDAGRARTPGEIVAAFVESSDRLVADVESIRDWQHLGEAPPGHITLSGVAHHALWDSWVHERDILLPIRGHQVEEPDEVAAALRYAAALSPALGRAGGDDRTGRVVVAAVDPGIAFTVDVGATVAVRACTEPAPGHTAVRGSAVDLLEAFSARAPFPPPVSDDWAWILDGLAASFDQI